jgi:hypothetical protein
MSFNSTAQKKSLAFTPPVIADMGSSLSADCRESRATVQNTYKQNLVIHHTDQRALFLGKASWSLNLDKHAK